MVFQGRRRLDNSSAYETSTYESGERKTFKLSELQDLPPQNQQPTRSFLGHMKNTNPKNATIHSGINPRNAETWKMDPDWIDVLPLKKIMGGYSSNRYVIVYQRLS